MASDSERGLDFIRTMVTRDVAGGDGGGRAAGSRHCRPLYHFALVLIRKRKAYVDSQNEEEIRTSRGTTQRRGTESPYRNRSVDENLDLFRRMREGEFQDGAHVLRAKIDMGHPNFLMRDPLLYRIRHASHYRRGDT